MTNFIFYCAILVMGLNSAEGLRLLIGNADFFEHLIVKHAVISVIMLCMYVAALSEKSRTCVLLLQFEFH